MHLILEEIRKKQQQQKANRFPAGRNPPLQKPPPNSMRPQFPAQPYQNPNQSQSPNYQSHSPNQRQPQPQRNPSPQFSQSQPQPQHQTNLKYPVQQFLNQSNLPGNAQGGFRAQNMKINIQQFPKPEGQANFNRNFQQNINTNMSGNLNSRIGFNNGNPIHTQNYNQNYNTNTYMSKNPQDNTRDTYPSPNPRNRSPNQPPTTTQHQGSPPQFPPPPQPQYQQQYQRQQRPRYQTQQQDPEVPQQQPYQQRQPRPNQHQGQDYQAQSQFQSPPNQYQTRQAQRQRFPRPQQEFKQQGDEYGGNQRNSPERGNYRGRGNNRGRGRGRQFRGKHQDEFVDNKKLTQQQAQQRKKKFISHNQPVKPRQSQKMVLDKKSTPRKQSKSQEQFQEMSEDDAEQESGSQMQEPEQSEGSAQQQSQEQYEDEQPENEESYHSQQMQEQAQEQGKSQEYSLMEERQQPLLSRSNRPRDEPIEGSSTQSLKMCSKKQFLNRMKIFMENNNDKIQSVGQELKVLNNNLSLDTSKSFSIFELNKKTYLPDPELTLKKFQRSANRADENDDSVENQAVYIPRSKGGLIKTMEHIKTEILDADTKSSEQLIFPVPVGQKRLEFIQIYVFLWDRMREMIKDITRLNQSSKHDREVIKMCEEITRFFILSINQGRKKYKNELDFDDKMNKESLVKIMTPLLGIYADSKLRLNQLIKKMEEQVRKSGSNQQITIEQVMKRMEEQGIYISPNQPEITSYAILFSVDYRKYLYENIFVGLQLQDYNPLYQSKQIQQVLSIKSALSLKNYSKYFDMIENEDFEYLLSCLMVLNIHEIRKEMSELLQSSFRYMSEGTRKKGVMSNYFKNYLRFENDQDYEFKKFLRTIKAHSKHDFVIWDDQISEGQQIYKSPPYALDFKLKRKYFLLGDDKKDRNMKRSDIVSRSWKKTTYVQELISCFLHRDYVPIIQISPNTTQKKEKQPKKAPIGSSSSPIIGQQPIQPKPTVSPANKLSTSDMLNAKIAKVKRLKFLQALSVKLADIFRPDQSKEQKKLKGAKDIYNILIKQHEYQLSSSFKLLENLVYEQIQRELVLIRIHKYTSLKNSFIDGFKSMPDEEDNKFSPFGLSSLLKRTQNEENNYMFGKKEGLNLPRLLQKNEIDQFNVKLFTDVGHDEPSYPLIEKVIKNIIMFLLGRFDLPSSGIVQRDYVYIQKDLTIKLSIQTLSEPSQQSHPQPNPTLSSILGIDSIIYLQTKSSTTKFSSILSKYFSLENSVQQSSNISLPIAVIKMLDSSKSIKFQKICFQPQFQCLEFLSGSALEISPSLNLGLIGFINVTIAKYRFRPKIQVKSISHIFNLIASNCYLVKNLFTPQQPTQSMFLCYQQYLNLCIQKALKLAKMYYLNPCIFENWITIIQKTQNQPVQPNQIESIMSRQYTQLQNLSYVLKIDSPYQANEDKLIFNRSDFISHYSCLIKKFDPNSLISNQRIVKIVDLLKIRDQNKLLGNIEEFYQELLKILGELLVEFNVACAQNFRFYLAKQQVLKAVDVILDKIQTKSRKMDERLRQMQNWKPFTMGISISDNDTNSQRVCQKSQALTVTKTSPNKTSNSRTKRPRHHEQFKYQRASWFDQVKKKIKID